VGEEAFDENKGERIDIIDIEERFREKKEQAKAKGKASRV